ncbi:MAG: 4Fe-4S dicluster domain-containing protein [Nitrospirae bacterium]|nr:MAG: 4Fe-4S dicluster domain-containing protein [Nitrospirota bacterium]
MNKQLALVIDLNKCVGCHACAANCKAWNTAGEFGPLTDIHPYGEEPYGVWFNRVQTYEIGKFPNTEVIYLPKSCMHCKDAPCVKVCPTGASYKRKEDGIVLVDYNVCIGCKYCSWACPYGCREFDEFEGVMKKCTLCIDRIYNDDLPEEERKPACVLACPTRARVFGDINDPKSEAYRWIKEGMGYKLLPEAETNPSNHYLPRKKVKIQIDKDDIRARKYYKVETEKKIVSYVIAEDIAAP